MSTGPAELRVELAARMDAGQRHLAGGPGLVPDGVHGPERKAGPEPMAQKPSNSNTSR
jgi:hypothetical protein